MAVPSEVEAMLSEVKALRASLVEAMEKLRAIISTRERYLRALWKARSMITATSLHPAELPFPDGVPELKRSIKVEERPLPRPLALAFFKTGSYDTVVIAASAGELRVEVGPLYGVLRRREPPSSLTVFLLLYCHLRKEHGIDVFDVVERGAGAPGLFDGTRKAVSLLLEIMGGC